MYHVPLDFVTSGNPVVLVDSLVSFDAYEVFSCSGEVAVHLGRCNLYSLVGGKSGCRLAHSGKHCRKHSVKLCLVSLKDIFFAGVNVVPEGLTLVEG